jgi:hypothetical protein
MATLSGIYRAAVVNNADPMSLNRVQISVLGTPGASGWAMACAPYSSGGNVSVPPVGETVWVMFENGDSNSPVWLGWMPS